MPLLGAEAPSSWLLGNEKMIVGKLRVFSCFLQTTSFFLLENSRMIIIIHDVIEGWPTHNGKHEAIPVI